MTIDSATTLRNTSEVAAKMTVQNEIQKEVLKDTMGPDSLPKQILSLMAASQPQQSVQNIAQGQIQRGFLDVKV